MEQHRYYRHSGQFSLGGILLGTLAASMVGSGLAFAYAALVLYIPLAGVITFVLAIGFGILLGLTSAASARWAKVRHEGVAFFSAVVTSFTSFYVCWASWTWLYLRHAEADARLATLVQQPAVFWDLLGQINAAGAWSMSGFTPTGAVLWVLWGAEALLILLPAMLLPVGILAVPFCERCEIWCASSQDVARLAYCDPTELKDAVEAKELRVLEQLGAPGAEDPSWIRADLHDCASCGNLHTLTLKAITATEDADGTRREKEEEVVTHLLLSTDEAHFFRALAPG